MSRLFLILLLCAYNIGSASAQTYKWQTQLDSLLTELPHPRPDIARIELLCRISYAYSFINPTEGVNYANQSLVLAQRLMIKKYIVSAYTYLGISYSAQFDFPKALIANIRGLKIAEEMKNKQFVSIFTGNIGSVYASLADYPKALSYFQRGLQAEEELGDKIGQVTSLSNIADVYHKLGAYQKALLYNQKSFTLNETLSFRGFPKEAALATIGTNYSKIGDYPKALDYLQRSLLINQASGDKGVRASIYLALSSLYLNIATDTSSAAVARLIGGNKTSILRKANHYADSTLVLANELGVSKAFHEAYKAKSDVLDALGESTAALANFKQYIATKDLIFNQDNADKIASAALQYEFDKKETTFQYEQQLTAAQLQKQTLLASQKEQVAKLANKERDVQRLLYIQEKAQKQAREKQLVISQKEQVLKATALELSQAELKSKTQQRTYLLAGFGLLMALLGFIVYGYTQQQKANKLLQTQRDQLEQALSELHATQTQLVQKEKMASLGELTAGIAHEIQNPLNFVTNFSEVSAELADEIRQEDQRADRDANLIGELLDDLTQNLQKITYHGGRASAIVRGMLEHSRTSTGEKRLTDLNALADEYLKIAFHGLRAKDKSFNAELTTDFQADLAAVNVVPQELGRVLLNLYNNAFYAVAQQQKTAPSGYQPTVTVSTAQLNGHTQIRVSDNGLGIPAHAQAKIFQPFFTTKPTGEGTGLGLSLSYDIITKGHQGSLRVSSQEGEGSEFVIQLPIASV